ncbi:ABC transporter permease [Streptacidiphilus carbonis]|jgi:ABC-2 type transport system permease protein|uniref:ABC transporter permease n=1 Tax=Streptacidiphilus carbonis TaxID=105422 RepID=UPI0005A5F8EA|nr:ABC transporter permease [Streptacidiphilus carbonis]
MTALAAARRATAPAPAADEPRARFRDLLAAEWLKLWTLRSNWWAIGLSGLALIAMNANGALADYTYWANYSQDVRDGFVPYGSLSDAFTNNAGICLLLAAGCIGAINVTGEYSTGLIRVSIAAVPARRSLLAAKIAVVSAVMTAYGFVVAFASFWITQAILSGRHAGVSISQPGAVHVIVVSALLAPVSALVGMGLGALIRHSATTMVTVIVLLLLLPNLLTDNHRWEADLSHSLLLRAWQRLKETGPQSLPPGLPGYHLATVAGSWTVYAVWPLVAVAIALTVVHRRDL